MPRPAELIVIIPRWVDDEDDLTVHLCAEDVCRERASAIRAGAHRRPLAKRTFRQGEESFGVLFNSSRWPAGFRVFERAE